LLVILKVVYPAALAGDVLFRTMLGAFPQMEWEWLHKDLAYLSEKGYLTGRPMPDAGPNGIADWRRQAYRLTPAGVELVDRCTIDPALGD